MVHRDFVICDVKEILSQTRTPFLRLAALFVGLALLIQGTQPVLAAAFGPFDSPHLRGTGEIMEPSADAASAPGDGQSKVPAALQSIPEPSFEVYEGLDRDINQSRKGNSRRGRSDNFFGVEGLSGLPFSLTAQEWTQQMDESGYWLEGDQWADFRAIALAGYLPEIRYWLGRDNWATLDLIYLGSELGGGFTNGTIEPSDGASYVTLPGGGGSYRGLSGVGGKTTTKDPEVKRQSAYELLLSMAKKLIRQPLLYIAILGGGILLFFALKRQSLINTS